MAASDKVKFALEDAVKKSDLALLTRLLDENPRCLESRHYAGPQFSHPPLHYARKPKVAALLLERGADPNQGGVQGATPLHTAAWRGDLSVCKLLLARGARPDARDLRGNTPLHSAAHEGKLEVARLLAGLAPLVANQEGKTPLDVARDWSHLEANRKVMEYLRSLGGGESIHDLAERGDVAALQALLQREPQLVHLRSGPAQRAALHLARDGGTVDALLEAGAALEAEAVDGRTPLHEAAAGGRLEAVQGLLARGAKVEARTPHGETPLHLAARGGHSAVARALLEAGADPRAGQDRRNTPWAEAEAAGHPETARLLAASGPEPDLLTAIRSGSLEVVGRLLDADPGLLAREKRALHLAVFAGREEMVRVLLDRGAEADALDGALMTPLHVAAQEGNRLGLAKLLLERGADPDGGKAAAGAEGHTPLHQAAMNADLELIRLLLERGATPSLCDEDGRTALDWAKEAEGANWRRAARLLRAALARPPRRAT